MGRGAGRVLRGVKNILRARRWRACGVMIVAEIRVNWCGLPKIFT